MIEENAVHKIERGRPMEKLNLPSVDVTTESTANMACVMPSDH